MSAPFGQPVALSCPVCGAAVEVWSGDVSAGRVARCRDGHAVDLRRTRIGLPEVERFLEDVGRFTPGPEPGSGLVDSGFGRGLDG